MAANTSPIFTIIPKISFGALTTGTNTYTGTSGATLLFSADAVDGSFVNKVVCEALGTNVTTVLRLFINNGSTVATATNNTLINQMSLPATTASATGATQHIEISLNIQLPPGYTIYGVLATTVAAGWQVTVLGGDY